MTYQLYWPLAAALIDNFQSAATRRMPVESERTAKIAAALVTEEVLALLPRARVALKEDP